MKRLQVWLYSLCFLIVACEKDENMVTLDTNGVAPAITSQTGGFTKVITPQTLNEGIEFAWSKADYGVETQVTYTVQVDTLGHSFATPVSLGSTAGDKLALTLGNLNDKLVNDLKVTPNLASALELRVVATINGKYAKASPVVMLNVTPYKDLTVRPATLWLPGGYQDWKPDLAPVIYANNESVFEGYVFISAGTGFKFTDAPDWEHTNYGYGGTAGKLTTDGLADGMSINTAGYYRFIADIENLTYDVALINSWGLIGTATPGVWDNSTPMTYDKVKDVWTVTQDLVAGALKFRANNDWGINYGPAVVADYTGTLVQTNDSINITEAGNYTVTLDFSRSKSPYKYSYTVVKN